jgi:bacteriocin biosynthesis cyclodehydratase domain-containing protein
MTLIHRLGRACADRVLAARADATVVIEGSGLVADIVGALLDSAGIGAVYQWPGPGAAGQSATDPREHAGADGRAVRRVRYHRPASQIRPTVVVLAGPHGPAAGRAAALVAAVIPHLAVRVTSARLMVGPLVLPGRSACANCIDRHRRDADPEWSAVGAAAPPQPSALLAHSAATLAASQVLDLVDTVRRPDAIGATIEQAAGSSFPQRRVWSMHNECQCSRVAALPSSGDRRVAALPSPGDRRVAALPSSGDVPAATVRAASDIPG